MEEKQDKAMNAETLANHFATLKALKEEYDLDGCRVWNLDETAITLEKEAKRSNKKSDLPDKMQPLILGRLSFNSNIESPSCYISAQ